VFYIILSLTLFSFIIPLTYCLLYHITLSFYKEFILLNTCDKLVRFVIYVPSHFNATFKRKKYFYCTIFHFVKAKTSGQSPALTSSRAPRVMVLKFCFFLFFFFVFFPDMYNSYWIGLLVNFPVIFALLLPHPYPHIPIIRLNSLYKPVLHPL